MPSIHLKRTDGDRHPRRKLSRAIVEEIRLAYAARNCSAAEFADEWAFRTKVSASTIRNVINGTKWRG